jgi:dienelactone hydrolase
MRSIWLILYLFVLIGPAAKAQPDVARRQAYLVELKKHLQLGPFNGTMATARDSTWSHWQQRTGELPPDFASMPDIPLLPDPLVWAEGKTAIQITKPQDWLRKKAWIREQYQHWVTGTFPPPPTNLTHQVLLDSLAPNGVRHQLIRLRFGPGQQATMTFKLFLPPSAKPLPVFMTQWTHERWAYLAVRRGYIGCVYAGSDSRDDTERYATLYPDYDFSRLARRAWGASRVLDYLMTLPQIDKEKIAITGHSRNGKQALIAGAFDERFAAVLASTGSIGGGLPFRFTDTKYDGESIDDVSNHFPNWFHPRLRFFMGREHKLPVDQNLLAATIAPRAFMFTSGYLEATSNTVGMEEMHKSLAKVYTFLGADPSEKLYLRARNGLHATSARDLEAFIDYLDRVFFKKDLPSHSYHYYNYDYTKWLRANANSQLPPPSPAISKALTQESKKSWETRRRQTKENLRWLLGTEPPGILNPGPGTLQNSRNADDWVARLLSAKDEIANKHTGRMLICPYNSMGDYLYAELFYPRTSDGKADLSRGKLPVFILQHSYSTATGYRWHIAPFIQELTRQGIAVLAFDMIGFGTRVEEGTLFNERYPQWSRMGKMIADLQGAIDALVHMEGIDSTRIYTGGSNLGSSVALMATALDERIKGVVAYSGFTPWRVIGNSTLGLQEFSHYFGLTPRLGRYVERPTDIPVDWPEIIASIAPRPVTLIAPTLDRHTHQTALPALKKDVAHVYGLYASKAFDMAQPEDFNRWQTNQQLAMAQKIVNLISRTQ